MNWTPIGVKCIRQSLKALKNIKRVEIVKDQVNVQTNADVIANDTIIKSLKHEKISGSIHSEEEKETIILGTGDKKINIILDPLDNTHLYLRGEKSFCSVAMAT